MTESSPIRAVFFDIDGTLTSFRTHEIPQSTIDALHELQNRGIKICICTGRTPEQMQIVLNMLPIQFDGIAGVNGQYCYTPDTLISRTPMDTQDVEAICDWLDEHPDIVATFGEENTTYFNHDSEELQQMWKSLGKTAPKLQFVDPRTRIDEHDIYQISPYVDAQQEEDILTHTQHVRGVRWHPDFVDLIPASGGKNRGIDSLLNYFDIPLEESMAFGDGGNDIDMLRHAHIGVAMGNATDATKEAADWVTSDVDDDGIARALRHFGVID